MKITSGQLVLLIVFTEFVIYAISLNVTNAIKHCATMRAFAQTIGFLDENEEEMKDENK